VPQLPPSRRPPQLRRLPSPIVHCRCRIRTRAHASRQGWTSNSSRSTDRGRWRDGKMAGWRRKRKTRKGRGSFRRTFTTPHPPWIVHPHPLQPHSHHPPKHFLSPSRCSSTASLVPGADMMNICFEH
jgi:hypothetical protein